MTRAENERLDTVKASDRAGATPDEARIGDRRGIGEALTVVGSLALAGYLANRPADSVEITSVTTAARGLFVQAGSAVRFMRKR